MAETARIVTAFAAEIRAARDWHQHAPDPLVTHCVNCAGTSGTRTLTAHKKSSWQVGVYTCQTCGWKTRQTWRNYHGPS